MGSITPNGTGSISFDRFYNIIDGELSSSASLHHGINPSTGEKLWDVPVATKQDVDASVSAANAAFKTWRKTSWKERSELLQQYAAEIQRQNSELASLLIQETGKPRFLAEGEIQMTIDTVLHFTELQLPERTVLDEEKSKVVRTTHEPIGVAAAICPWNFPCALPMNKLGPALQAGNCIIMKPSPHAPYTLLKLAEIARRVFPRGVVQCLGGDHSNALGQMLTEHPHIHKISFTGSTAVGKKVMAAAAGTVKRVTLELGGNDATIVCSSVDVKAVASQVALGVFLNTGQVCASTKRLFVHRDIYSQMMEALTDEVSHLKVGGDELGVMVGPLQNKMQFERVKAYFQEAKDCGYRLSAGSFDIPSGNGFFINPTIIDGPPSDSRLVMEEQFGPILPVQPWDDEDEVITRANDTKFGLSACVWSKDIAQARRIGAELEAGSVYINSFQQPTFQGSFGGIKESGIGSEFGVNGLLEYCNIKSTYINF
ncbi:hypothetical protein B7494_g6171 [Chlorociboria aeruginascens]|nr:hypothetical protein B7494_g6171 [Chlorociboria aeruginascens]